MEADYSDIMEEEEHAREIADREDAEEEQRQKEEKKRKKFRRLVEQGYKGTLDDLSSEELSDEY